MQRHGHPTVIRDLLRVTAEARTLTYD